MNYVNITYPDINNGLGVRLSIWLSGCSLHCEGCHNKELWDRKVGKPFNTDDVIEYIKFILSTRPYIDGITITGGDALAGKTYDDLIELERFLYIFKSIFPNLSVWIYSGLNYDKIMKNQIMSKILTHCDVLVDGPFKIAERDITIPFRGSRNQRLIDLKKSKVNKVVLLNIE